MAKMTKKDFFAEGFLNRPMLDRDHLGVPTDPFQQVINAARLDAKSGLADHNEKARKEIAKRMAEEEKVRKAMQKRQEQYQMEMMAKKFADPIKNAKVEDKDPFTLKRGAQNFVRGTSKVIDGVTLSRLFGGQGLTGTAIDKWGNDWLKEAMSNESTQLKVADIANEFLAPTIPMAGAYKAIDKGMDISKMLMNPKASDLARNAQMGKGGELSKQAWSETAGIGAMAGLAYNVGENAMAGIGPGGDQRSDIEKTLTTVVEGGVGALGDVAARGLGRWLSSPISTEENQVIANELKLQLDQAMRLNSKGPDPFNVLAQPQQPPKVDEMFDLLGARSQVAPKVDFSTTPGNVKKGVEENSALTRKKLEQRQKEFVSEQRQALDGEAKRIQEQAKTDLNEFKATLKNTEDNFVQTRLEDSGYHNQIGEYEGVTKKARDELTQIKAIVGDKIFIPKENRADFPQFPTGYISAKADGRYDIYKAAEVAGFGDDVEGFANYVRRLLDDSNTRKKDIVTVDIKKLEADARQEFKSSQEYKSLQETFNQIRKGYDEQIAQYKNITDEQLSSSFQKSDEYISTMRTLNKIRSEASGKPDISVSSTKTKETPVKIPKKPEPKASQPAGPKHYKLHKSMPHSSQKEIKNVMDVTVDKNGNLNVVGEPGDIKVNTIEKKVSDTNAVFKKLDAMVNGKKSELSGVGSSLWKQAERLGRARGKAYDTIDKRLKPVLKELTKRNGAFKEEQFYDYIKAKHYLDEINRNPDVKLPKGWNEAKIKNILNSNKGNSALDKAQKGFVRVLRDEFKKKYDAGLISKEFYENSIAKHDNYIPMFRDIPEEELFKTVPSYMPKARNVDGSELEIIDPVQSAVGQIIHTNVHAERNLFYQSLEKLTTNPKTSKYFKKADNRDIGKDGTFTVFNNGEPTTYRVSKEISFALDHLSPRQSADLIEIVGKVTQTFKKGITDYNPFFYPVSTVRDGAQAVMNARDWKAMDVLTGRVVKDLGAGLLDAFLPQTWKKQLGIKDYRTLYEGAGASHSQLIGGDMNVDKILKQIKDPKYASVRKYLSILPEIGRRAEMSTRLSVMRASDRAGKSLDDQIHEAVDVTNYLRSGSVGKDLNKVSMFFNPSLRGLERNMKMFTEGPKAAAQASFKIAAYAMAPAALSASLPYLPKESVPWMSDDQRLKMKQLQDWEHNMFLHFPHPDGERIIRIHKPYFIGQAFMNPLQEVIRAQGEERPVELSRLASEAWATNLPPMAVNMLQPFMVLTGAMTKDPMTGIDIVPRRLEGREDKDQYDTSTLEMAKELGGWLGISPKKIDYVMRRTAGAVGDMSVSTLDWFMQEVGMLDKKTAATPEEEKWHKRLDIFLRSEYAGSGLTSDMYDVGNKLTKERTSERGKIRDAVRAQDVFADEKQIDKLLDKRNGFYQFDREAEYEKANEVLSQLNEFATLARNIRANEHLSSKEKDAQLKQLRKSEREFNEQNRQLITLLKGK